MIPWRSVPTSVPLVRNSAEACKPAGTSVLASILLGPSEAGA